MRSRNPLAAISGAPGAFRHTKTLLLSALAFNTPAAHAQSSSVELPGSVLEFGGRVVDQQLATQSFIGQASGISVKENAHEIRIELEADVLFDFDKADIRPSAAQALHQVASLIRTHGTGPVRVEGHTRFEGYRRLQPAPFRAPSQRCAPLACAKGAFNISGVYDYRIRRKPACCT